MLAFLAHLGIERSALAAAGSALDAFGVGFGFIMDAPIIGSSM